MLEKLDMDYTGDLTERYIRFSAVPDVSDFREKMLENNRIKGYLRLKRRSEEGKDYYCYDISGMRAYSEYLSDRHVGPGLLLELLENLEKVFVCGRDYCFDENDYVLHPDAVFVDEESGIKVCYLPGYGTDIRQQLADFFEYVMNLADVADKKGVYAAYMCFSLAKSGNSTFASMIEALKKSDEVEGDANYSDKTNRIASIEERNIGRKPEKKDNNVENEHVFKEMLNSVLSHVGLTLSCLAFAGLVIFFLMT